MRAGIAFGLLFTVGCGVSAAARLSDESDFSVTPNIIHMGAFSPTGAVRVQGMTDAGAKVVVTVVGEECDEGFNTKGRVGPIWLNAGKVRISGVPSLFLRFSSDPVGKLLGGDAIDSRELDEKALLRRMRIDPAEDGRHSLLRAHYLALKRGQGSYRFVDSTIAIGASAQGEHPFRLEFAWPRRAAPGTYNIHVYEIRNGAVIREGTLPLQVVRTGFPEWISGFAQQRAALYGVTAVLVSAVAGFGIDLFTMLLFGKKKRATAH